MTEAMSMDELRRLYISEQRDRVVAIKVLLEASRNENSETTYELYRSFHNLAGSGGSYGFPYITELCLRMKIMIEPHRQSGHPLPEDVRIELGKGVGNLESYFNRAFQSKNGTKMEDTFKPQLVSEVMKIFPHTPTHDADVPMKILAVEDDEATMSLIRWCFSRENFEVQQARDKEEAELAIQLERPDIILVNPRSGASTGVEFIRKFKASDANKLTPIIVISNENMIEDRIAANEAKADGFISKPFHPKELVSVVKNGIEKSHSIQDLVINDALTGAYSRRYIFERLREEMKRHQRKMDPLCLAIIDLDYFKKVNDTYGHLAGDEILRRLIAFLKKNLRSYDIVGRYGGEEFIILMPNTTRNNAEMVLDRIRSEWAATDHHIGGGIILKVTFSGGISVMDREGLRLEDLVYHADRALYAAKDEGRNRIRTEDA